jgi:hypothetical protein
MAEVVMTEVAVGGKVRVHFHPPGSMRSFSEGVVRRVDVTTPQGRFFVVEVAARGSPRPRAPHQTRV